MVKLVLNELYRFRMLIAGVMVALGVSTTYGFSIFTNHMKEKYGMNQINITTISTVGNCLGYCAFLLGVIFDHYGPKIQMIVSGVLAALGLLLFGFAFDDLFTYSTNTMVILFSVFNGIMYLGCPSLDGASILPLMMNFPLDRGYMIIIQKTFSGLGTSIIMAYFSAFFKATTTGGSSKFSAFSYFLAAQVMLVAVVGAIFIDLPTYAPCDRVKRKLSPVELKERQDTLKIYMTQAPPRFRFYIGCTIVGLLLVFLTVTSLTGSFVTYSLATERGIWAAVIVLLFSFSVMALPFQWLGRYRVPDRPSEFPGLGVVNDYNDEEEERRCSAVEPVANEDAEGEVEATSTTAGSQEQRNGLVGGLHTVAQDTDVTPKGPLPEESEDSDGSGVVKFGSSGDPQYHGSFWSHLLTIDLWLFWLSFFSMWGTGTVLIFNAAQLYRSKAYGTFSVSQQALYVGLIGVGSAIGRILSGVIDLLVARRRMTGEKKKNIYTIMFFPLSSILLAISFLLIAVLPAPAIVLPFILGAMGNGMGWGLGALCVRIVYAEDIGKHYNYMWSSGIVATVGLNLFMFGGMFDKTADSEGTSPMCDSPKCVIPQMWILLGCNVVSTLAAFALQWRFCRFSNRRLKEAEADEERELGRVFAPQEEKDEGEDF